MFGEGFVMFCDGFVVFCEGFVVCRGVLLGVCGVL